MVADSAFYFMLGIFLFSIILYTLWAMIVVERPFSPYNKFKINVERRYISVDGEVVPFAEIEYITTHEMQQPSFWESQYFHRAGFFTHFTSVTFHLQDKANVSCIFNTKASLYNTLKKISPFVVVDADIKQYKTVAHWIWFLFPLICQILILIYLKNSA
ncbi:MAG: hypothetical protein IJ311_03725 [Elusimicrobiaceae bacterium]|nr:hypothetical protein [Elusimicrobiaceae bacterium]